MNEPFYIIQPKGKKVPIIISVPHCGTSFPDELIDDYNPNMIQTPDDTDWFVHKLYDFATKHGITIIYAKYSRWVIDLNRDPESAPLYNDGRIITGLTPSTDFFGNDIYLNESKIPNQEEINRRLATYYWPYYNKIETLINELKMNFKDVVLWDAHSIRQSVPTIRKENFPDMILGNNDEKTAHPKLIETTLNGLKSGKFGVNHNTPFKGGHITRYFGNPEKNIHALQLEMVKTLYMDDEELNYNESRANEVRKILEPIFKNLIQTLDQL